MCGETADGEAPRQAYSDITAQVGPAFHHPSGHLWFSASIGDPELAAAECIGKEFSAPVAHLDEAALRERFPTLSIPAGATGLYEGGGARSIKPQAMVAAQLAAAEAQGATIQRDVVTAMRRTSDSLTIATKSAPPTLTGDHQQHRPACTPRGRWLSCAGPAASLRRAGEDRQ